MSETGNHHVDANGTAWHFASGRVADDKLVIGIRNRPFHVDHHEDLVHLFVQPIRSNRTTGHLGRLTLSE